MAVLLRQIAFGRSADVSEEEGRGRLGRYAREVDAVPCWNRGCEDARFGAQGGRCVVANAEAIAVVRAPSVLSGVSRSCSGIAEGERTSRRRESNDCVRIECEGFRMSSDNRISSLPLYTCGV
jgi:hypothetical protein